MLTSCAAPLHLQYCQEFFVEHLRVFLVWSCFSKESIKKKIPTFSNGGAMSELNDFNQKVISEFRANQGKVGGQLANMPVLLLTTTGAKSGRTITKPLAYTTDGDRIVVLASFAGGPKNPPWYHNLVANPVATVEL